MKSLIQTPVNSRILSPMVMNGKPIISGNLFVMDNIIGKRSGRLVVTEYLGLTLNGKQRSTMVLCKCDCGNCRKVSLYQFNNCHVRSCGCLAVERKSQFGVYSSQATHGQTNHPVYHVWCGMISRCYNEENKAYHRYGGRGIKICDEWLNDVSKFCEWAIEKGYKNGLTIERENNDGDYEPANCKWATDEEQANNRSTTRYILLDGIKMSMANACKKLGLPYKIINQRTKRDELSFEEAVLKPFRKSPQSKKRTNDADKTQTTTA